MKSKSFELPKNLPDEVKQNKTFDFVKYYKTAPETSSPENNVSKVKSHTPKRVISPNKNKKKIKKEMDISQINIDGSNLSLGAGNSSSLEISQVTSTPNVTKNGKKTKVKSIMKNFVEEEAPNVSIANDSIAKPKKRNKSVSFMLDENEVVVIKKSKSEESVSDTKIENDKKLHKSKKNKKPNNNTSDGKENKSDANNMKIHIDKSEKSKKKAFKIKAEVENTLREASMEDPAIGSPDNNKQDKKTNKCNKKLKSVESSPKSDEDVTESENIKTEENQVKKIKKKRRKTKSLQVTNTEIDGEPASKSRKKELKPEAIAEGLENLNIGDNPHSLSSLIDEMTVADKKKIKKHQKKKPKLQNENAPREESEPGITDKVKVKWVKRKFNKDKKGTISEDKHLTSIIIENLPLTIMCTYKKLLAEHFTKFGIVQQVCVAEVYPLEDPSPVFTTTVVFYSEDAAEKSLQEDNTLFRGNRIRVKRPLPPTQTTIVVRSFAELSLQALSSLFSSAGRIRNIRNILKGKKAMATAFVEFDGPETLNRALKISDGAKIGGKKIHAAKFEFRKINKNKENKTNDANNVESDSSD